MGDQRRLIRTFNLTQECHESYYEGELLNGLDLKVKAVRGLSNR